MITDHANEYGHCRGMVTVTAETKYTCSAPSTVWNEGAAHSHERQGE